MGICLRYSIYCISCRAYFLFTMSIYKSDRAFSDYIHKKLALPLIYEHLNWEEVQLRQDYAKYIDMLDGIDYVFRSGNSVMSVQERFRDKKYTSFNDFTIRYRRDFNAVESRHQSEYYKLKAHYFTYAIVDCSKENFMNATSFVKYAVIDLRKVYEKIDTQKIVVVDNGKHLCQLTNDKRIECPILYNSDGSSSFFPIDIALLVKLWGSEMIITQMGFI